jgi:hypothetical protein
LKISWKLSLDWATRPFLRQDGKPSAPPPTGYVDVQASIDTGDEAKLYSIKDIGKFFGNVAYAGLTKGVPLQQPSGSTVCRGVVTWRIVGRGIWMF